MHAKIIFILQLATVTAAVVPPIRRNAGHLVWQCHSSFPISAARSSPCPEDGTQEESIGGGAQALASGR